jgi:hypothetical protein
MLTPGEFVVTRDGGNLGAAISHFARRMASGGIVGAFSAGVHGYAAGGQVAHAAGSALGAQTYHQLDIRTDKGSFRAAVGKDTLDALQSSALAGKLSRTGEKPSWFA